MEFERPGDPALPKNAVKSCRLTRPRLLGAPRHPWK